MKFNGIDSQLYQTHVLDNYQKDIAFAKKHIPVGIVGFVLTVLSGLWLYLTISQDKDPSVGIVVVSLAGSIFAYSFVGVVYFSIARKKYVGQLHLTKREIVIEVLPDLTFAISEKGVLVATIKQIKQLTISQKKYALQIHGVIETPTALLNEYDISKAIQNYGTLRLLLELKLHQQNYQTYHNDTMKKIMYLEESTRKQIFLKELRDTSFLVAGSLSDLNPLTSVYLTFANDIIMQIAHNEQFIHVYTEISEIDPDTINANPVLYVLSLKELLHQFYKQKTHVFHDQKTTFGIIINPNNEKLCLNGEQLEAIFPEFN